MKRLGLALAFWASLSCAAMAQVGGLSFPGPGPRVAAGAPSFSGLADVLAAPTDIWSCARAASAALASTSTNLCDLVAVTGGAAVCTLRATTTGKVDLSAYCPGSVTPAAACAAASGGSCKVTQAYGQINGHNASDSTLASMPALVFSSLGGLPCMQFTSAANAFLKTASFTAIASPQTVYGVMQRTANFTTHQIVFADNNLDADVGWNASANSLIMESSTTQISAAIASDGAYHAIGFILGASAAFAVDGTTTAASGSTGTTSFGGGISIGDFGSFTPGSDALVCEIGIWPISGTGTNNSNISTNQHSLANGYNF